MSGEERLLLRLERQEQSFEEARKMLVEAQKGFLRGLGWKPLSKSEEYWAEPANGKNWPLWVAVKRAKNSVREKDLSVG